MKNTNEKQKLILTKITIKDKLKPIFNSKSKTAMMNI